MSPSHPAADPEHFLAEAGAALGASLDPETTAVVATRLAATHLADWVLLCAGTPDDLPLIAATATAGPDAVVTAENFTESRAEWTGCPALLLDMVDAGQPVLRPQAPALLRDLLAAGPQKLQPRDGLDLQSFIIVPLLARGHTTGVLCLADTADREPYTVSDLPLVRAFAQRLALALDNARRFQAERQAVEAHEETMKIVSHDLRAPLSVIVLGSYMAEQLLDGEREDVRQHIERVRIAAEQMDRMLRDLMDAHRLESGHLPLHLRPEAMDRLLSEIADGLHFLAAERDIQLLVRIDDDLPMVMADANRIAQVLSNLVGNAIKFTPRFGHIEIHVHAVDSGIRVAVSDDGPGIDVSQVDRLFERFWQARPDDSGGIGLGLSIARGIVEAHGGAIGAVNRAQGGSTFHFILPTAEAAASVAV